MATQTGAGSSISSVGNNCSTNPQLSGVARLTTIVWIGNGITTLVTSHLTLPVPAISTPGSIPYDLLGPTPHTWRTTVPQTYQHTKDVKETTRITRNKVDDTRNISGMWCQVALPCLNLSNAGEIRHVVALSYNHSINGLNVHNSVLPILLVEHGTALCDQPLYVIHHEQSLCIEP